MLLRRTRLGLLQARELSVKPAGGASPVEVVGNILAHELGWDGERLALELERFAQEADAEGIVAEVERPDASDAEGVSRDGTADPAALRAAPATGGPRPGTTT